MGLRQLSGKEALDARRSRRVPSGAGEEVCGMWVKRFLRDVGLAVLFVAVLSAVILVLW